MDVQNGAMAAGAVAIVMSIVMVGAHIAKQFRDRSAVLFAQDKALIIVWSYLTVLAFIWGCFAL